MPIFKETSRIKTYDVDKNGKLSVHQLFNFFQEAAYRHSVTGKFGQPDLAELNLVWMLSRISLTISDVAHLGEDIEVNTWIRSILGSLSERDFGITKKGKELVKATSMWACLSKDTFKPTHIPPKLVARMPINTKNAYDFATHKITSLTDWENSTTYQIVPSDVDMVNHTNNVAYVRMALNTLRVEQPIATIDVNFLRQSYLDDTVTIRTKTVDTSAKAEIVSDKEEVIFRMKLSFH
ncbi:MAG: hypothetical protein KDC79_07715 [Cyclobacteriaceae bacterium]|nr:hypothetical protein [Cyclobacteriaceae bacterium]